MTAVDGTVQVVKLLAGTQNRVVHTLDIVPALPPLKNYAATDYGRWISKNATTVLEVRPRRALMLKCLFLATHPAIR